MYPHPDKKREHHVIDTYLFKMNQKNFNMHQKMTFLCLPLKCLKILLHNCSY